MGIYGEKKQLQKKFLLMRKIEPKKKKKTSPKQKQLKKLFMIGNCLMKLNQFGSGQPRKSLIVNTPSSSNLFPRINPNHLVEFTSSQKVKFHSREFCLFLKVRLNLCLIPKQEKKQTLSSCTCVACSSQTI